MDPWNAIITARGDRLAGARKALRALGHVERTGFYNVLAMKVDEPMGFLDRLERLVAEHPDVVESVAYVFPAERCFDFSTTAERIKSGLSLMPFSPQFEKRVTRRASPLTIPTRSC